MISMQEKRDIWLKSFRENRDRMEGRVKRDIETYRKGDCTLHRALKKLGAFLPNVK